MAALLPLSAHAGVFAFVSNMLSAKEVYVSEDGTSYDTGGKLTVLEPSLSPNPRSYGGADIVVEDESSLVAEAGPSGGPESDVRTNNSGRIAVYVVREGDTMSQIAKMFGVTTNTIAWANDISNGVITPGETLVILPISGVQHTVKKGDTLASIAKQYGADSDEIISYNHLEGTTLAVGEVVVVPDGEIKHTTSVSKSSGGSSSGSTSTSGYFIRPLKGGVKTQGIHGYNAVDIAAQSGTNVFASAGGEVIISRNGGWNGGYGNYVVVSHSNGTQTLYAHLSSAIVSAGSQVVQGQVVGYVGNTGKSTGSHLHFEVRGATNPF